MNFNYESGFENIIGEVINNRKNNRIIIKHRFNKMIWNR